MTHYEMNSIKLYKINSHDVFFCSKELFSKYLKLGTRVSIDQNLIYPDPTGEYIVCKHYYKYKHWYSFWKTKRLLWMGSDIEYIGTKGV